METSERSTHPSNPTRRDFLKILPAIGSSFLLAGCAGDLETLPTASPSSVTIPMPSETKSPTLDATPSSSPVPPARETTSPTPRPPDEYLPAIDGSFSSYQLPNPQFLDSCSVLQALQQRHSSRVFLQDELPISFISTILWAGFGINRPDGKRTAPTAYNVQDIDIFLAVGKGLFRYTASNHSLAPLSVVDIRPFTGTQAFVSSAPLNLVYVSDYSRIQAPAEDCVQWSWAHSGCIAQNIYLACAVLGLATVVRSTIDRSTLAAQMGLSANQHITLAQTIGYPG